MFTDKLRQFITKRKWDFDSLENLSAYEFNILVVEIPSDVESNANDYVSDDDKEQGALTLPSPNEAIPEQNEVVHNKEESSFEGNETSSCNTEVFDKGILDEENIPLINFVPDVGIKIIWRRNSAPATVPHFAGEYGPIPECETPLEIFTQLF